MDRNLWWGVRKAVGSLSLSARRAWIEMQVFQRIAKPFRSLSARRAWIEILPALKLIACQKSLSARRAWIEIAVLELIPLTDPVALRKESVDRNIAEMSSKEVFWCRSPQGERG